MLTCTHPAVRAAAARILAALLLGAAGCCLLAAHCRICCCPLSVLRLRRCTPCSLITVHTPYIPQGHVHQAGAWGEPQRPQRPGDSSGGLVVHQAAAGAQGAGAEGLWWGDALGSAGSFRLGSAVTNCWQAAWVMLAEGAQVGTCISHPSPSALLHTQTCSRSSC